MNKNQLFKVLSRKADGFGSPELGFYHDETVAFLKDATAFYLGENVSPVHIEDLLFPTQEGRQRRLLALEDCMTKLPFPTVFLYGSLRTEPSDPPISFSILLRPRDDKWIYEVPANEGAEFMDFMITPILTYFREDESHPSRVPQNQYAAVLPFACIPTKLPRTGVISIMRENVFRIGKDMAHMLEDPMFQLNVVKLSETIVFYFLKLLSCKNIIVREECLGKKKGKKHLPMLDYHTLHIKVPGKKYVYEDKVSETIPFHEKEKFGMVGQKRGHFKTYTEDKPLFGRHVGTWWWSPIFDAKKKCDYAVEIA